MIYFLPYLKSCVMSNLFDQRKTVFRGFSAPGFGEHEHIRGSLKTIPHFNAGRKPFATDF